MAEILSERPLVTAPAEKQEPSGTLGAVAGALDFLIVAALGWFGMVAVQTTPAEDLPQTLSPRLWILFGGVALALLASLAVRRLAPMVRGLLSALAGSLLLSLVLGYGNNLWATADRFDPRVAISWPLLAVAALALLRFLFSIHRDCSPAVGAAVGAPLLLIVLAWFTFLNLIPCLLPMRTPWTEFYPSVLRLIWKTVHYGLLLWGATTAAQERLPSYVLAVVMALALIAKLIGLGAIPFR